ncbi:MAG: type II secretion system F family protein [Armatimonadetes bacterium]|nr:type II secretion system F family protein [Armatimonadota bacterium]
MPTFTYQAKNEDGKDTSGVIEADDAREASNRLREQGLFTMHLAAARNAPAATVTQRGETAPRLLPGGQYVPVGAQTTIHAAPFLVGVPLPDLAIMFRQMGTLFNAGVPMVQAITTLATQSQNGRLKDILKDAAQTVAGGHPLSAALERYPAVFTPIQIELVRAGEIGGLLEVMCERIAGYLEREIETRRKLKRETMYPKIVLGVAGFVILLLTFVQNGMGKTGANLVVSRVGFAAGVGAIAFAVWWAGRYLNQYPAFGAAWDRAKMLVPGAGDVARKYATARFARAMGALYAGGVNLFRAVEIGARACGNRAIGEQILRLAPLLQQGSGLSEMLAQSGLLSPIAVQMARTGEQTGSLDTMMDKVADYLEDEADVKAHQLAVGTGVFALLLAACVVAYIVISFYGGMMTSLLKEAG